MVQMSLTNVLGKPEMSNEVYIKTIAKCHRDLHRAGVSKQCVGVTLNAVTEINFMETFVAWGYYHAKT